MSNKVKDTDEIMIDAGYVPVSGEQIEEESTGIKKLTDEEETVKPKFRPATINELNNGAPQVRRIPVPPNRFTPLKKEWKKIYEPLVKHLNLQVKMNVRSNRVEIKTSKYTEDPGSLQKAADFIKAFMLGFDIDDAIAILRVDDLFIDSFDIKDVKNLGDDHLSRAIGRIAGKNGKVKFAIENTSKTRIVLAETSVHILGSYQNIKIARDSVVSLILGSPPGKVHANLRTITARMKQRF
ncbi:6770_t:CDS:2 [Funneliformis caledonium]|uniref:Pre-rRNA-processing protein PNO1 n=2 Tax=Funneliformis TaxID=1117308 RepID=A0A9N9B589_9GLOM|nr:6770_t:CDS:2 [Funneliformis caledonium]